ncbi:MAG: hypothetical protein WBA22_17910 [Candidatus Methanofastidiosia archaeon]
MNGVPNPSHVPGIAVPFRDPASYVPLVRWLLLGYHRHRTSSRVEASMYYLEELGQNLPSKFRARLLTQGGKI